MEDFLIREEIYSLKDTKWLEKSVVDSYLSHLRESIDISKRDQVYLFKSDFFSLYTFGNKSSLERFEQISEGFARERFNEKEPPNHAVLLFESLLLVCDKIERQRYEPFHFGFD